MGAVMCRSRYKEQFVFGKPMCLDIEYLNLATNHLAILEYSRNRGSWVNMEVQSLCQSLFHCHRDECFVAQGR